MELPQISDYRSLFLNDVPLLDVRAPVEFMQGAFPLSTNFPLLNDKERESIGIEYKNLGQDQAIKLGHQLVQGDIKNERVCLWEEFFKRHPEGILYCFRGGMRSKISQQWIHDKTGIVVPRVQGGYKAMRRFLIDELESSVKRLNPIMLGGRTGIGKTILLTKFTQQLDLEGILNHRGSVFGKHVSPQPAQIDIENTISIELLKHLNHQHNTLVIEDEAPNIGSRKIPEVLFTKMKLSPLILLEASVEERVSITFQEYITESLSEHQQHYGEEKGFALWTEQLNQSIDKIKRRLGGSRHKELKSLLSDAIQQQISHNNIQSHKDWINYLLVDYYDPMYDFQISKKLDRVVFKGNQSDVLEYLHSQNVF